MRRSPFRFAEFTRPARFSPAKGVAALAAACCLCALSACNPGPSKAAVKEAIDAQLNQPGEAMCWSVTDPNPQFPLRVDTSADKPLHPILAGLQKEGLISIDKAQFEGFFSRPFLVISITQKGQAAKPWTPGQGFCVGRRGVDEVKDFTEPAPSDGVISSQATFSWKVVDVPAWANRDDFAGVPGMTQPGQGQALLVKTNEGWKARRVSTDTVPGKAPFDASSAAAAAGASAASGPGV